MNLLQSRADITVLTMGTMTVHEEEILVAKIVITIIDSRLRYRNSRLDKSVSPYFVEFLVILP